MSVSLKPFSLRHLLIASGHHRKRILCRSLCLLGGPCLHVQLDAILRDDGEYRSWDDYLAPRRSVRMSMMLTQCFVDCNPVFPRVYGTAKTNLEDPAHLASAPILGDPDFKSKVGLRFSTLDSDFCLSMFEVLSHPVLLRRSVVWSINLISYRGARVVQGSGVLCAPSESQQEGSRFFAP
jgi:hypothetical protein